MEPQAQTDRRRLDSAPEAILPLLPTLGRLMAIGKHKGVTHERIGPVEQVVFANGCARLEGAAHAGELDLSSVRTISADFTAMMGDRAMPRLALDGADGQPVLSFVMLDGREAFDRAFGDVPARLADPLAPAPRPAQAALDDDDPGFLLLDALRQSEETVELILEARGFRQRWRGKVGTVSRAMGFSNVMTETFHLHLRGGAVARWGRENDTGRLAALDSHGLPIGLFIVAVDAASQLPLLQGEAW